MDEFDRAVPDHLRGSITQDGHRARADLNEISRGVCHQDEVLRGLENTLPLLDLLAERGLRAFALADVARGFGSANDLTGCRSDRRHGKRNIDLAAVLVQPQCFVMLDGFALSYSTKILTHLGVLVGRNDDIDA